MTSSVSRIVPTSALTVSRSELVALLGDWVGAHDSLYVALADTIAACVTRGDVVPGTRLPSERELARGLCVSRGTVMAAYDRLRQTGWAESRGGSGTRIRTDVSRPLVPTPLGGAETGRYRGLSGRLLAPETGVVDLALALVREPENLPAELFDLPRDLVMSIAATTGIAPQGAEALREAIAQRYQKQGVPTGAEQVVVTGGGQQGIDLCAGLTVRPGDTVLVEEATYPGALAVFARHGARLRTVPVQAPWGDSRSLLEAIAVHRPRLVYLMPGMHNPCGTAATESWRRQLAHVADTNDLYLVEDDSLGDLVFDPAPSNRPVSAYSRSGRVLSIGSLSKSVWGGLRTGWVRADANVAGQLGQLKAAQDLGLSAFGQAAALQVLPQLDHLARERTATLRARADVLLELLATHLPEWHVVAPEGGLTVWARLPEGCAEDFAQLALRQGVAVSPGASHCAGTDRTDRIRVSFAQHPDVLAEGVRRLAAAWTKTSADGLEPRPGFLSA